MRKKKLPSSIRKHVRKEKARIRREVSDLAQQQGLIKQLREKFLEQYVNQRNIRTGN